MNEEDARDWLVRELNVPRETMDRLAHLAQIVRDEGARQNLISAATMEAMWARHIVDSAQLVAQLRPGSILDIGSGAGFPGLVVALLRDDAMLLVEPRRKRADFLRTAAKALSLSHVAIRQSRVEIVAARPFDAITARAFAPLAAIFAAAEHLADDATRWVLPKGRNAQSELAAARETWHGEFEVVASVTDPEASIVVAENVRRKACRGTGR